MSVDVSNSDAWRYAFVTGVDKRTWLRVLNREKAMFARTLGRIASVTLLKGFSPRPQNAGTRLLSAMCLFLPLF
jgi:hypothetical protein